MRPDKRRERIYPIHAGIDPNTLIEQVRNTASWTLSDPYPCAAVFSNVADIRTRWQGSPIDPEYFRLLLSAHYATVATFTPTDVDARIRQHHVNALDQEGLAVAVRTLFEVAAWSASLVSSRVVREGTHEFSGHLGEWMSVAAGALGRAYTLGAAPEIEMLEAFLEDLLAAHARAFESIRSEPGRELDALRLSTVIAHNLGDLSRVAEEWPKKIAAKSLAYMSLGHATQSRFGRTFYCVGEINKRWMAKENHRFLALRRPKALRQSRDLLLPMGPFFDAWARLVIDRLDDEELLTVIEGLFETYARNPSELGCLRALYQVQEYKRGGLKPFLEGLPARLRKLAQAKELREMFSVPEAAFEAKMIAKWRLTARELFTS